MRTTIAFHFFQRGILFWLLLSCTGGNNKKIAEDFYDKLYSSARYKTYRTLSERIKYDKVAVLDSFAGAIGEEEQYMRALLGYSWIFSGKPASALAESDIIANRSDRPEERIMAHTLKALLIYEMGGVELAESERTLLEEEKTPEIPGQGFQTMVFHLLSGTLALKERKFEKASADFGTVGRITEVWWPWRLADALADMEGEDLPSGLQKLNDLILHAETPEEVRIVLAGVLADRNRNPGRETDPSEWWPGSFSFLLVDQLQRSSLEGIKNKGKTLQKLREKMVL